MRLILMDAYVILSIEITDIVQKRFTFFTQREPLAAHFTFNLTGTSLMTADIDGSDLNLRVVQEVICAIKRLIWIAWQSAWCSLVSLKL